MIILASEILQNDYMFLSLLKQLNAIITSNGDYET